MHTDALTWEQTKKQKCNVTFIIAVEKVATKTEKNVNKSKLCQGVLISKLLTGNETPQSDLNSNSNNKSNGNNNSSKDGMLKHVEAQERQELQSVS